MLFKTDLAVTPLLLLFLLLHALHLSFLLFDRAGLVEGTPTQNDVSDRDAIIIIDGE